MTTSTTAPASAFAAYRDAQARAVNLPDDGTLTRVGRIRAQAAILRPARDALAAAIPAPSDQAADPVASVLAARRAKNADDVALHTRQREIVHAQLATGRQLAAIIDQADESRLAAIIDGLDDDPAVLASSDPDGVAAEVRERVFARLVALGTEDAVTAAAQVRESQAAAAWHAALTELHSASGLSYPTRAALHDADPEGYAATIAADADRTAAENVVHLDRETARVLAAADNLGDA